MNVRVLEKTEMKVSSISTKTWPAGWTGAVPDEIAVQMILLGVAVDPTGEVTRAGLEAEIARLQEAANVETAQTPVPVTEPPPKRSPKSSTRKPKAADTAPQG